MDYTFEAFISWCDDITIAEEGLLDKKISVSYAKKASSIEDVRKLTSDEWPIIKLEGDLKSEVQTKIRKAKLQSGVAKVGINIISIIGGLLTGHVVVADPSYVDSSMKKTTNNLQLYSSYIFEGDLYLKHKGVKIVE